MTDDPAWIEESLAAYALGALDGPERERIESLIARDAGAAQRLAELRSVLDLLPQALPSIAPPAELRGRVLAAARGEGAASSAPRASPPRQLAPGRPVRWAPWALAASLTAVAGLAAWNLWLRERLQAPRRFGELIDVPHGRVFALAGSGDPDARARVFVDKGDAGGELLVAGLSPLASDRVYQLWFARTGQPPRSGGAFRVDDRGEARVRIHVPHTLDDVRAIAITEEPAPGVDAPTGQHLLDLVQ